MPTESSNVYDPHTYRRAQIDRQVSLLKQQIQKLHAERNTLLPVSCVPNEILSAIFLLCQTCRSSDMTSLGGALSLTWVCHHWRIVTLSTAPLWAYIGNQNIQWAGECLIRSKQALLEVHLIFRDRSIINLGAITFSQIHRVRQLAARFRWQNSLDEDTKRLLASFLTQPAPFLESLILGNFTDIPTPIFSGISPALRTLSLVQCIIPSWTSNLLPFRDLRHLSLEDCDDIPVIEFIQSFPPSLPNLDTLHLANTLLASPTPANMPLPPRVHFPNLKCLRLLHRTVSPITQLFGLCSFVPETVVDVDIVAEQDETAFELLQLLQASERFHLPSTLTMRLSHENYRGCRFIIKDLAGPDDEKTALSFQLTHERPWLEIAQILPNLPIRKVTTLTLSLPELIVDDWTNVFAQFIHLEDLTLDDLSAAQSFMRFIIASTPDDFSDTATADLDSRPGLSIPTLHFKSLRRLRLGECHFKHLLDDFLTFANALKVRKEYGLHLEQLYIPEYTSYISRLAEIVDKVIIS
ncbi:hypothetical protein BDN72DRAFT_966147 [Pluteus cervinus]|uniref:Uncharacterized protein n=1 Tax=Pluteus cervinus TaxID=181527 RepID=A0ACD3A0G0_9AGAR|nr:hypothetical protein BDN72DRAFT_966147 [Pluteus cervinus]